MSRIVLDIAPATKTHCAPKGARFLNPDERCPKMTINPSYCGVFDAALEWEDEHPLRLRRCIAAELDE